MNRYEITAQIGDGTFGRVYLATLKEKNNNSIVAIKQIKKKMKSWSECISLREIQSLRELSHPNIVSMREVMLESDGSLYFVFEYMPDGSLYELMKRCIDTKKTLSNARVASYTKQILNGLAFLHDEKSYFHRDVKPENVLVTGDTIKLADFGLCRDVGANPPYTYYVSTRWYRAPEVILRSLSYGPPIDLYATGLILAELYSLQPLLPGSSELDQIKLMSDLIGSPTDDWEEGIELMQRMKLVPPRTSSQRRETTQDEVELRIRQRLPKEVPSSAANLIASLLCWNPHHRPSAKECMQHELFTPQSQSANRVSLSPKGKEEEQTQYNEPSTVKRSNLSNERKRRRVEDFTSMEREDITSDLTQTQREASSKLRFASLKRSEDYQEDKNEFSDYLAAVSNSKSVLLPTASGRVGNKIRPLFEKENRSFTEAEESVHDRANFQEITGFDYPNPKSIRKKKNSKLSNSRKMYGHRSGIASALGRGIAVQISNQTPFVLAEDVANIWNKTEQDGNEF